MSKEAMKLALEALEESKTNNDTMEFYDRKNKAITALQALAEQPALKVVDCHATGVCVQSGLRAEQPAQPQQEPVAWYDEEYDSAYTAAELDGGNVDGLQPLYTSPPTLSLAQRTWVGLTDEEIEKIWNSGVRAFFLLARAIEAKLKAKNNVN